MKKQSHVYEKTKQNFLCTNNNIDKNILTDLPTNITSNTSLEENFLKKYTQNNCQKKGIA